MARLQEAQKRLEKALTQLEQATSAQASTMHDDLAAAGRRCSMLEDRNRDVARRLDAAIERVRDILNG
jgi:hypothetical protein